MSLNSVNIELSKLPNSNLHNRIKLSGQPSASETEKTEYFPDQEGSKKSCPTRSYESYQPVQKYSIHDQSFNPSKPEVSSGSIDSTKNIEKSFLAKIKFKVQSLQNSWNKYHILKNVLKVVIASSALFALVSGIGFLSPAYFWGGFFGAVSLSVLYIFLSLKTDKLNFQQEMLEKTLSVFQRNLIDIRQEFNSKTEESYDAYLDRRFSEIRNDNIIQEKITDSFDHDALRDLIKNDYKVSDDFKPRVEGIVTWITYPHEQIRKSSR